MRELFTGLFFIEYQRTNKKGKRRRSDRIQRVNTIRKEKKKHLRAEKQLVKPMTDTI